MPRVLYLPIILIEFNHILNQRAAPPQSDAAVICHLLIRSSGYSRQANAGELGICPEQLCVAWVLLGARAGSPCGDTLPHLNPHQPMISRVLCYFFENAVLFRSILYIDEVTFCPRHSRLPAGDYNLMSSD